MHGTVLINNRDFLDLSKKMPVSCPWVEDMKEKAKAIFYEIPVPDLKQEDWRFTPLDRVLNSTFQLSALKEIPEIDRSNFPMIRPENINIIFVDGQLMEIERVPEVPFEAVRIIEWGKGAGDAFARDMRNALMNFDCHQTAFFSALNKAFFYNGVFLQINEHTQIKPLIHIVHISTGKSSNRLALPRVLIRLKQHSGAQIVMTYLGDNSGGASLNVPLTEIVLDHEATLNFVHAQDETSAAFHFSTIHAVLNRDSHLHAFSLSMGGALARNDLSVHLREPHAEASINGLYCVNHDQLVHNHTIIYHPVEQCSSRQEYKGILTDSSRAVFNGKIRVSPQAQGTESYQLNKNLLLGKEARVHAKPELEIEADDVKCSHGAAVGQLNEDHIFYLLSRGISRKDAVRMLAEGFARDLILGQKHIGIRKHLLDLLRPKLEEMI